MSTCLYRRMCQQVYHFYRRKCRKFYIDICVNRSIQTYVSTGLYRRMCQQVYTDICVNMSIYTYVSTGLYRYVSTGLYRRMCQHVYTDVCVNRFIQTYVSTGLYGQCVNVWDWKHHTIVQRIDLGKDGLLPLEIRFLHDPLAAEAYVGCALGSAVFRLFRKEVRVDSLKSLKATSSVRGFLFLFQNHVNQYKF